MSDLLSELAKAKAMFQQKTVVAVLEEKPLQFCSQCGEGENTDAIDWTCGNGCGGWDL